MITRISPTVNHDVRCTLSIMQFRVIRIVKWYLGSWSGHTQCRYCKSQNIHRPYWFDAFNNLLSGKWPNDLDFGRSIIPPFVELSIKYCMAINYGPTGSCWKGRSSRLWHFAPRHVVEHSKFYDSNFGRRTMIANDRSRDERNPPFQRSMNLSPKRY